MTEPTRLPRLTTEALTAAAEAHWYAINTRGHGRTTEPNDREISAMRAAFCAAWQVLGAPAGPPIALPFAEDEVAGIAAQTLFDEAGGGGGASGDAVTMLAEICDANGRAVARALFHPTPAEVL